MAYYCRCDHGMLVRAAALLSAVMLLAFAPTASAQSVLNENLTSDGTTQPIQLFADQIATWTEAGQQIFLLQGNVAVSQGANAIRASDAVVWVDMSRFQAEKILNVIVYGENPITVERGKASARKDFGYVRLATTNKIDIKPFKSKVVQADRTIHPVYQKALLSRPADVLVPTRKNDDTALRPVLGTGIRQVGDPEPMFAPKPMVPLQPEPVAPQPKQTVTYLQVPGEPKVDPLGGGPADGPITPPAPPIFSPNPPTAPSTAAPTKPPPRISIRPRYDGGLQASYETLEPGLTATIVTGGVSLQVTIFSDKPGVGPSTLDMEADRAVIWTRGNSPNVLSNVKTPQTVENGAHEIYLAGHVELRTRTAQERDTLRADELYYDVRRGVAVARKVEMEIESGKLPRPIRFVTDEFLQVNPKLYKMAHASFAASILPSDPGLRVDVDDLTIEEFQKEKTYLWGIPVYDKDGQRIVTTERIFMGRNFVTRIEEVPVFYFPYYRANVERPLGPLDSFNVGFDRIFGMQVNTTWDMFELLNLTRPDGQRWRLFLDELTARGPGFGTEYDFEGKDLLGVKSKYAGMVRLYGIYDKGQDILGGNRGNVIDWPDQFSPNPITHPQFRGWANGKINVQDLPDGFSVLGQFSFLSDRNYLEQYYLNTQLNDMNQDTFLYVKQQQANWAWTLQGQVNTQQDWLTQTNWLPKADGYLLGQTLLDDWLVYNARASAGYAQLRPTIQVPFAYLPTDVRANAARLDYNQDISLPFYLGPVKVAPYLTLDTAFYSEDVNGEARGRLLGGAGVKWNMPLSRIFPDVQSELLNVNGIYHKINLTGNYYIAQSSSGVNNFPQFDPLNDNATDQALRDIRPVQTVYNPINANFLTTSNLFNPQNYAIRRLIDTNIDTLDTIDVLQLAIQQRWQTKRGFPGNEHVVDWMSLNVGVSIFPQSVRDNYGHTFGILEYDWTWNIGDRTALTSSGWSEPYAGGPRVFDFGGVTGRPDGTSFYLGYRQIDPLNSKAVVASITYPISAKYALQASTVWDFGNRVTSYSLFVSRMGTDVMVNFGLSFNSTVNTFGINFEMLPNLVRPPRTAGLFPMPLMNIDPMVNQR